MQMARLAPAGVRRALRHWPLLPGLALAAWLRLWDLFPTFLFGDEAEYASVARSLSLDWRALAYPELEGFGPAPFVSQPPLLLYVFAASMRMGGLESGPILVSAILGIATLVLVYRLGVRMADRWLGGTAALLFAVMPPHVGLSRGAQLDAGFTFLVVLAMVAFIAWADRPHPARALLAGLAIAAACMAKLPGVLVLMPIGLVLLGMLVAAVRRSGHDDAGARADLRRLGRHIALAALPLALMASLYVAMLWHLRATSNLVEKLGWQADRVSGAQSGNTERSWEWYFTDPGVGLQVQIGIVLLLLAGVGMVLLTTAVMRSPRDRVARALVLLWPVTFLAFFLMSDRKEWFYLAPITPALALLAGWTVHRAWLATLWPHGRPTVPPAARRGAAVFAALTLVLLAGLSPAAASVEERVLRSNQYGSGVKEAALWIDAQDPAAAQVGSLLGRFALHLYNGHPTYHYFVNHTFIDDEAEAGRLRFVVRDPYLNLSYERAWMQDLVQRHNGTLVYEITNDNGRAVQVYRLDPSAASVIASNLTRPA